MNKKKVLYILPPPSGKGIYKGVNGPEIRVKEIIRNWKEENIVPVILYPSSGRLINDFDEFNRKGIAIMQKFDAPASRLKYLSAIFSSVSKYKPDIIHSHGSIDFDFFAFLAVIFFRAKLVISRPIMITEDITMSAKYRIIFRLLDFIFLRWSSKLIAISKKQMEVWKKEMHWLPKSKMKIVYNGVDLKRFYPTPFPNLEKIRFGIIAQLTPVKGHTTLMDAAYRLKERGYNFELRIVGDGPLRKELEDYSEQRQLKEIVKFTGHIERVEEMLREIHVVVLPSAREGIPVSLLEAMACGRPVIASHVGGCSEVVHNGLNGFLIPRSDVEALIAAMLKFLDNPSLVEEMGKQSALISRSYSLESMYEGYINIYHDCIGA